ncbi:MAG TPA: CdaR family transcriptional regulator, partial [Solirubrobacteraceae bacterium]
MADLQELVDDLAAEIGRPISVEDRRWRLLAHSAHTGATDTVRRTTILARAAPPEVAAWLESLGVLQARDLVEVPPNAELDMAARVVMPVRHDDVLLGFVWVVAGEQPLSDGERAALARTAGLAQGLLWERRTQLEQQQHLLRTLLFDDDAT